MKNKNLVKNKDPKQVIEENIELPYEKKAINKNLKIELDKAKDQMKIEPESAIFKILTLNEFEKGLLMASSLPDIHRPFALEFSLGLQKEFECKTLHEKSLAEAISFHYSRMLYINQKISNVLNNRTLNKTDIKYLDTLSKELDRAQRHYLNTLQSLKAIKQPNMQVNLKTNTAVVGQNQIIQTVNEETINAK